MASGATKSCGRGLRLQGAPDMSEVTRTLLWKTHGGERLTRPSAHAARPRAIRACARVRWARAD
jgi:hypothetical protein